MKVLVIGASGRVGAQLINKLVTNGHSVVAATRHPEEVCNHSLVESLYFDIAEDYSEYIPYLQGIEAIYFVAGSRGKNLLQIDAFGPVKAAILAKRLAVKRFILLSSIFATEPEKWNDPNLVNITDYNIAKFFADHWLISNSQLDYTIIQPGNLQDSEYESGRVEFGVAKSQPNSILNVASVLANVLEANNTFGKIIQMSDGNMPIKDAISTIK